MHPFLCAFLLFCTFLVISGQNQTEEVEWEPLRIGLVHELNERRLPARILKPLEKAALNLHQMISVSPLPPGHSFDLAALRSCSPTADFNATVLSTLSPAGGPMETRKLNERNLRKYANFVLIVQTATADCFADRFVLATAKPCGAFGNQRPSIARMSVCLNNKKWRTFPSAFDLFRHEFLHALGFGMFELHNASTPAPRTVAWSSAGRTTNFTIHFMDFAHKALKAARLHFGCPQLAGIEADDEQKFHLNEYSFGNELMTPILADGPNYFTTISASILEETFFGDRPWYKTNRKLVDEETKFYWFGRNFGCEFFERSCFELVARRKFSRSSSPLAFCSEKELWKTLRRERVHFCFNDGRTLRRLGGTCQMREDAGDLAGMEAISLNAAFPSMFRGVPDRLFGSSAVHRFCPMVEEIAAGEFFDLPPNSMLVPCPPTG